MRRLLLLVVHSDGFINIRTIESDIDTIIMYHPRLIINSLQSKEG